MSFHVYFVCFGDVLAIAPCASHSFPLFECGSQMSKAPQIKALVKQICHGNSTAILPKLVDSAVSLSVSPDDAAALMHSLIDAIDMFASHPSAVHKCLFIIETCLRGNSQPFFEAARTFAPEIRLIPLLTFERPKCQIRAQIHATAFEIYHCLVHGRAIGEQQYEDAVQATFHRPLTDQVPSQPRKVSDDGGSVSFWDIAQNQADSQAPPKEIASMPIPHSKPSTPASEGIRPPADQFALFSQFPQSPSGPPDRNSGELPMGGGQSRSQHRFDLTGIPPPSEMTKNPFTPGRNPFVTEKKEERYDPFAQFQSGQDPFAKQSEQTQESEATFDPFAQFNSGHPSVGVDPFAQACSEAGGDQEQGARGSSEGFNPFVQFNSGQSSVGVDPFAQAGAHLPGVKSTPMFSPFERQEEVFDPFGQNGMGSGFDPFQMASGQTQDPFAAAGAGLVDPFADMVVPEFSLELNIKGDGNAEPVIPAQLDPFASAGSGSYPVRDPFA